MKTKEEWAEIAAKLAAPFPASDIEWRVSRAGTRSNEIWCLVFAYVNNRPIMDRFDDVLGIGGWEDSFTVGPQGGVMCGITIDGITKYDGAENTKIEPVKGGFSDSEKRAAVKWGPGRYLYGLTENFAEVSTSRRKGWNYAKAKTDAKYPAGNYDAFYWCPPPLPEWALPAGTPPMRGPLPNPSDHGDDPRKKSRKENMAWLTDNDKEMWNKLTIDEQLNMELLYKEANTEGLGDAICAFQARLKREG